MRTRRERIRRVLAASAIAVAAILAVLVIAGDVLLGRIRVTDGRSLLAGGAWQAAGRWIWADAGPDAVPAVPGARAPAFGTPAPDVYFALKGEETGLDLHRSRWTPGGWSPPEPLFELNTATDETDPLVLDGGAALVFATDRAGGQGGFDLWIARRAGEGWSAPEPLPAPLNSGNDDRQPTCDASGSRWVLASNRLAEDGVRLELFETLRTGAAFSPPRLIQTLVTDDGGEARAPALSPDGRFLVFASDRSGGRGGYDLWRSFSYGDAWQPPELIEDLAGPRDETDAAWSAEGTRLVFVRAPPAGEAGASVLAAAERRDLVRLREDDGGLLEKLLAVLAAILLALLSTWLYLRWGRMHPFIKFILISMIIHLLVMLYLHTRPKEVILEGGGGEKAFTVTFAGGDAGDAAAATAAAAAEPTGDQVSASRAEAAAKAAFAPRGAAAPSADAPDSSAALAARAVEMAEAARPAPVAEESQASAPETAAASPAPTAMEADAARSGADAAPGGAVDGARSVESARAAARDANRPRGVAVRAAPDAGDASSRPLAATRSAGGAPGAEALAAADAASASGVERPAAALARGSAREGAAREGAEAPVPGLVGAASGDAGAPRASPEAGGGRTASGAIASADVAAPAGSAVRRAAAPGAAEAMPAPEAGDLARSAAPPGASGLAPAAREPHPAGAMTPPASGADAPLVAGAQALAPGARREPAPSVPGRGTAAARARATDDAGEAKPLVAGRAMGGTPAPAAPAAASASAITSPRPMARESRRAETGPSGDAPAGPGPAADPPAPSLAMASVRADRRDVFSLAGPSPSPSPDGAAPESPSSGREIAAASLLRARRPALAPPAADAPASVYAQRTGAARVEALKRGGGSDETEAAVLAGLRYLKQRQRPGGAWGASARHDKYGDFRVGKTALALLAYLGSGHTHRSEGEFRETVGAGFGFLLGQQERPSGHFGDSEGYGHGIATYALAEAYALSKDPALEAPLRAAVRRIVDAQVKDRRGRVRGGWSYYYADPQRSYDRWPRMSVSVWQIMALKSARLGGIDVPDAAFDLAREFVLKAHDPELGAFRYNHDPEWLNGAYPTLPGSNSAALFALQLLGVGRDDPRYGTALAYVEARRPVTEWRRHPDREFATMGAGNEYYLYYATLGLFCHGGAEWAAWNREMTDLVVRAQRKDGSWKNASYYADYAGDTDQDRAYTTAMAVLTLEVYYRYFTPLLSAMSPGPPAPETDGNGGKPR